MKTAKFYTKMLFYVATTFILMGCHETRKRQTTESGEKKEIALLQKKVNITSYPVSGDFSLISFNTLYCDNLHDFILSDTITFNHSDLSEINNDNLVSIVIYAKSDADNIDYSDVDKMLFYVRKEDGFRTFLLENRKEAFELNPKYTFHSNFISSNDIFDLYKIISPDSKAHCYMLLNGRKLPKTLSTKESSLQLFISKNRK